MYYIQGVGDKSKPKTNITPFTCLITVLCEVVGVPHILKHDQHERSIQYIDITRINYAVDNEMENQPKLPDTSPSIATFTTTLKPTTAQPQVPLPALSKMGLLARKTNAKVDKLTKEFPKLIRQALIPVQASVSFLQQQYQSYEDRIKQFELRLEKVERGEVGDMPRPRKDVYEIKLELLKMQNLKFDLTPFLPKQGEQGTGNSILGLEFDSTNIMTAPEAQGVERSKAPAFTIHIDIPSWEGPGETEWESNKGDTKDEETDDDALVDETEGH